MIFICFAAEDRYDIAEPLVYHLKNYGIDVWYDRHSLLLGDDRKQKNLIEGASKCKYAILILSANTTRSACAMEEISIINTRYTENDVVVFPILFELSPNDISSELQWVKDLIFKETDKKSGTRQICNHIMCKVTSDILCRFRQKSIKDIINIEADVIPPAIHNLLNAYCQINIENLNARIALLYAVYITSIENSHSKENDNLYIVSKIFERLFSETRLDLVIDYRELWLLENAVCILINEIYITKNLK